MTHVDALGDFLLLQFLRRLVVVRDLLHEALDAFVGRFLEVTIGDDRSELVLPANRLHSVLHPPRGGARFGGRSGGLGDFVLVDVDAVIAQHAFARRNGTIALLTLINHRDVIDEHIPTRIMDDVVDNLLRTLRRVRESDPRPPATDSKPVWPIHG